MAVFFKTQNTRLKTIVKTALPVGLLGIGEPLIYGVTLPLFKPFIGACLGAAVGGAVVAAFHVTSAIPFGVSGLVFYRTSDFKNAVLNFEYVVSNGGRYSDSDYYSALLKLADSYNKAGKPKKTIRLYSKIEKEKIPSVVHYAFIEYTGRFRAAARCKCVCGTETYS